jgi:hypothetical protein
MQVCELKEIIVVVLADCIPNCWLSGCLYALLRLVTIYIYCWLSDCFRHSWLCDCLYALLRLVTVYMHCWLSDSMFSSVSMFAATTQYHLVQFSISLCMLEPYYF